MVLTGSPANRNPISNGTILGVGTWDKPPFPQPTKEKPKKEIKYVREFSWYIGYYVFGLNLGQLHYLHDVIIFEFFFACYCII